MSRLDERSYLQVLAAIYSVREALDPDNFGSTALCEIAQVVPSDVSSFNEVDPAGGRFSFLVEPPSFPIPSGSAETLAQFAHEHPLIRHAIVTGDGSALRISDICTPQQWHENPIFGAFYGPMGIEHQMSIGLPAPLPIVVGIALNRVDTDFSDRDRTVLELLRPHLAQSWRHARDHQRIAGLVRNATGALESTQTGVVVLSNPLHELTPGALTELYRSFGRPGRSDPLPLRVSRWVDAQRALAANAELNRPLWAKREDGRLVMRFLGSNAEHDDAILLTEVPTPVGRAKLTSVGLTAREAEVLEAVATGATNAEIGEQLFIAASTVKKYLDRIYSKLGVSGRTRAAAVFVEMQGHHEV